MLGIPITLSGDSCVKLAKVYVGSLLHEVVFRLTTEASFFLFNVIYECDEIKTVAQVGVKIQ